MDLGFANPLAPATTALLASLGIEAATAAFLAAATGWGRPGRAALAAILATLATQPLAWAWVLDRAEPDTYLTVVLEVEAAVIVVESLAYRLLVSRSASRCLVLSAVANAASAGLGFLGAALG